MGNFNDETMNILLKFLDKKSRKAMKEIEEKGTLSEENAIPLILKTQFNHIAHLDKELSAFRETVDKKIDSNFKWTLMILLGSWVTIIGTFVGFFLTLAK